MCSVRNGAGPACERKVASAAALVPTVVVTAGHQEGVRSGGVGRTPRRLRQRTDFEASERLRIRTGLSRRRIAPKGSRPLRD